MSRPKKKGLNKRDMEASFDAFLKESISSEESSIDTARIMKLIDPHKAKTRDPSWWMENVEEEDDDNDMGLTATGSKFLKKSKKPKPSRDVKLLQKSGEKSVSFSQDVGISRDSLDDESLGIRGTEPKGSPLVPALSLSLGSSQSITDTITGIQPKTLGAGKETLDELADKERFFKELEKSSDDTLDYSRLNREMDGSATLAATLENVEEAVYSDEPGSPLLTAKRTANKQELAQNKETDMLSKVALIDSMDSTLGTKLAGSRDTRESDDMHTIPEGTREEDVTHEDAAYVPRRAHFEDEDQLDGHHMDDDTDGNRAADSRGYTLKTITGTGMGYSDTSHEIEALHSAMRHQVGMATLDDTKDFTFKDSSTNQTQDMTDADGTGAFGLKAVALSKYDKSQRTADDIMREVEEFTGHSMDGAASRRLYTLDEDNIDGPDGLGFGLSPAHMGSYGGNDSTSAADDGHDITPFEKAQKHKVQFVPQYSESDLSPITQPRSRSQVIDLGHESPDGSYPVPTQRTKKDKSEKKSKLLHIKSSGYGQSSPSPKRKSKTSQKTWNPGEIQKHKTMGTDSTSKGKKDLGGRRHGSEVQTATSSLAENHLVQSVQSFASYIQDQFSLFTPAEPRSSAELQHDGVSSSQQKMAALERERKLVREVQEWQDQWKEERRILAKVKATMSSVERDCKNKVEQMRIEHEQEIFKLKQENYVLSAKIVEDKQQRPPLDLNSLEGVGKEQLVLLEKEVREQEKLLAGYQQENERLYQEMKKMQQSNKIIEEKMFRENQKMKVEVANLREQLSMKEQQLKSKGLITAPSVQQQIAAGNVGSAVLGAGRIAQLEAEIKQAKSRETAFKLEIDTLNQTRKELELHIDHLVQQNEQLESRVGDSRFTEMQETKGNLLKYEKEIDRLKNKLKWYAENQELLDRDANKMKHQEESIYRLKQKLDSVQSEAGKKTMEARMKTRERTQDAKKIQDLERQVREMETILRKRHPNSLPVLMWAASNTSDVDDKKSPSVVYLEKRILKLERELEEKDDEAKKSLRVMEQKYNVMKVQYEQRIESVEMQLSHDQRLDDRNLKEGEQPHTHVSALQRQLDSVRERHKKKQAEMEAEIDKLKRELSTAKSKENAAKASESRLAKEVESETSLRVKALQLEVVNQDRDKQQMQKMIERLQQEKNQITMNMTRSLSQANKAQGEKLQNKVLSKTKVITKAGKKAAPSNIDPKLGGMSLPPCSDAQANDKQYEPMVFTGHHISDIRKENEELKQKVEMLQFEVEQQRVMSQKLVAESEALMRRSREDTEDKVTALRSAHQAEIQKLLSEQAMHHSTSRLAQLQGQLDTQEVVTKHLREQLSQSAVDRERMSMLTIRETTLESQLKHLNEELQHAKQLHTPEMKHFISLQDKIRDMEARHGQRERELQTIIQHSRTMAHADMADEINKWRRLVDTKNHELERFRMELDSILDVLKELQRQGVVLPCKGSGSGSGYSSHR